jgi:hypothetical protein
MANYKRTRGVGDFNTSDLPNGHRPTNGAYYRTFKRSNKNVKTSTRTSRLTGQKVETLQAKMVNGYEVTVNRYDGDDANVQVFIDRGEKSITQSVPMDELDDFIARNTRT